MSADNTIVVGCFIGKNSPIYHVAHIQALENYDYFIEREEWENLDEWLLRTGRQLRGVNPTTEIYLKRIDDE